MQVWLGDVSDRHWSGRPQFPVSVYTEALMTYESSFSNRPGSSTVISPTDYANVPREQLRLLANQMRKERNLRQKMFAPDLFGDPVWDMLVALYCSDAGDVPISTTSAICAAAVPYSTGLRWLHVMELRGLIHRLHDQKDARSTLISLTRAGKTNMERYLTRVASARPQSGRESLASKL